MGGQRTEDRGKRKEQRTKNKEQRIGSSFLRLPRCNLMEAGHSSFLALAWSLGQKTGRMPVCHTGSEPDWRLGCLCYVRRDGHRDRGPAKRRKIGVVQSDCGPS